MKVACHFEPGSTRSRHIAHAMTLGCDALGIDVKMVKGFDYVEGTVGVAYGWAHPDLFEKYRKVGGHFVYIDLGWWDRKPIGSPLAGYHKLVVDAREPTAYFRKAFPDDRFLAQGLKVHERRKGGRHILVAGMSAKSAGTRGYRPLEWENGVIEIIRRLTNRPILFRPKPSWPDAKPIPGTIYSPPEQSVESALEDCWMAVSLHSNVAVDALLAGVPINVREGVCMDLSTPLAEINTPRQYPQKRIHQLMADIAYCQWNMAELSSGAAMAHLLEHSPLCA